MLFFALYHIFPGRLRNPPGFFIFVWNLFILIYAILEGPVTLWNVTGFNMPSPESAILGDLRRFFGPDGTTYHLAQKMPLEAKSKKINFFCKNYKKSIVYLKIMTNFAFGFDKEIQRTRPVPRQNNNSYGNIEIHNPRNQPQFQNQGFGHIRRKEG